MDRDTRRKILEAHGLNPDLLAVDPSGCGCTECIIGEYIPSDRITRDEVPLYQSLIRQGVLGDHTSGWFMIGAEGDSELDDLKRQIREIAEALQDHGYYDLNDAYVVRKAKELLELVED